MTLRVTGSEWQAFLENQTSAATYVSIPFPCPKLVVCGRGTLCFLRFRQPRPLKASARDELCEDRVRAVLAVSHAPELSVPRLPISSPGASGPTLPCPKQGRSFIRSMASARSPARRRGTLAHSARVCGHPGRNSGRVQPRLRYERQLKMESAASEILDGAHHLRDPDGIEDCLDVWI